MFIQDQNTRHRPSKQQLRIQSDTLVSGREYVWCLGGDGEM